MGYVWLAGIIIFFILETVTVQLVCIWFAGGALGGLIAALCGANALTQVFIFTIVSAVLLVCSRPFIKKKLDRPKEPTNADRLIGQVFPLTEEVNNTTGTGKIMVNGIEWSVKSADGSMIENNSSVKVKQISGSKLIVEKFQ